jgi:hypothetical protein
MPWCDCHSFDSLESETAPILKHADIAELVFISALEFIPSSGLTDDQRKIAHDKIMKLQEEFLRKICERLRVYRETLRSEWSRSQRDSIKFE